MHIDMNLNHLHTLRPSGAIPGLSVIGPDSELPAHKSLRRVLRLLHAVNVRLSVFTFETLPGTMNSRELFSAVETAVDDSGLAFELDDGRIGALVYGWRPPGTGDDWVESRTLARLDWALGGPNTAGGIVDVYAIHSPSSEIATDADVLGLLSLAMRVERFIPPESVRIA
tara:strand:+ start:4168 stop:4677 length:510 start_codon:yes stop_codon:yes gene_type:complete